MEQAFSEDALKNERFARNLNAFSKDTSHFATIAKYVTLAAETRRQQPSKAWNLPCREWEPVDVDRGHKAWLKASGDKIQAGPLPNVTTRALNQRRKRSKHPSTILPVTLIPHSKPQVVYVTDKGHIDSRASFGNFFTTFRLPCHTRAFARYL